MADDRSVDGHADVPDPMTRFAKGGAWALGGKTAAAASVLVVNAMLARALPPDELGAFFIVLSLVAFGATIGVLGVDSAAVREIASRPSTSEEPDRASFLALAIAVVAFGACLAAFAYLTLHPFVAQSFGTQALSRAAAAIAIWISLATLQRLLTEVFRGFHDIRMSTLLAGIGTRGSGILSGLLLPLGITGLMLFDSISLPAVLLLAACTSGIVVIAGLIALMKRARIDWRTLARPGWVRIRSLAALSLPLLGASVLVSIRLQADIWILSAVQEAALVAQYGAALRLVGIVVTPLLVLNSVVPPIVARLHRAGDMQKLETTLRAAATLVSLPSLMALGALALWGAPLLGLVYGDYYREANPVLLLLCIGQAVNVYAGSCGIALVYTRHQYANLMITLASTLLVVLLGIGLAGRYGAAGMAVASSLGLVLQNGLAASVVRKRLGIWTHLRLTPRGLREATALLRGRRL